MSQFDLSGYSSSVGVSTPTLGVALNSGDNVLDYTLTFQSDVNYIMMPYTTLTLMGKSYYVLSASATQITLLDSSASASLAQGGSTTLTAGNTTYTVSADYIDSNGNVKLTVNGETTNTLQKGDTYQLTNGAYVGIKDVLAQGYSGGTSDVDFSIGQGKIVLNNGGTVQVNSNSVDGVTSVINTDGSNKLTSLLLEWDAADDVAITQSMPLSMPTFAAVKVAFTGMTYPKNETTTVTNDGDTAVRISTVDTNGPVTLDILGMDKTTGNFTTIGKDNNHLLQTSTNTTLVFNAAGTNSSSELVASWANAKSAESYVFKINNFVNDSGTIKADLVSEDGGSTTTMTNATSFNVGVGDIVFTPIIDYADKIVTLNANVGTSFNTLYTADGLQIILPTLADGATTLGGALNASGDTLQSYPISFYEADKDGNLGAGGAFNITVGGVGNSGSEQTSVTDIVGAGSGIESGSSNIYQYTELTPLATTIQYNQGPTQETATVTYHGGESYGTLSLSSSSASISGGGALGNVLVTDSEVSTVSSKNLIVVGGSCINTAAAALVGGAYCGSAWTTATGIGSGQFLIKSYPTSSLTSQMALLVAGYEAADTTNAATYLTTQSVDTSQSYTGTSGTSATLNVA